MKTLEKEMQFLEELLANHFNWIFRDSANQLIVARNLTKPIYFDENYIMIGDEDNEDFPYITNDLTEPVNIEDLLNVQKQVAMSI